MSYRFKIGIVGWSTGGNGFGATKSYLNHLSNFGEIIILCPSKHITENLDLVVLPGGKDTYSNRYGEPPGYYNTDADQFKEFFLDNNLDQYISKGTPVWGTCLGMQMLLVKAGAPLVQNIDIFSHGYSKETEPGELVHELVFPEEFKWLENKLINQKKQKKDEIKVCSRHHQAIEVSDIPEEYHLIAHSPDGYVEAIMHKELPIAGGQSHVEDDFNRLSNYLIKQLLLRSPNYKNYEQSIRDIQVN